MLTQPIPEMSAKKVIFRMENCGHLSAEVCGVLEHFVRKSAQAGNFFCADVRNISICRSAERSADINADIFADVCMDGCRRLRTSAWTGVDIRRAKGSVRVAAPAV